MRLNWVVSPRRRRLPPPPASARSCTRRWRGSDGDLERYARSSTSTGRNWTSRPSGSARKERRARLYVRLRTLSPRAGREGGRVIGAEEFRFAVDVAAEAETCRADELHREADPGRDDRLTASSTGSRPIRPAGEHCMRAGENGADERGGPERAVVVDLKTGERGPTPRRTCASTLSWRPIRSPSAGLVEGARRALAGARLVSCQDARQGDYRSRIQHTLERRARAAFLQRVRSGARHGRHRLHGAGGGALRDTQVACHAVPHPHVRRWS